MRSVLTHHIAFFTLDRASSMRSRYRVLFRESPRQTDYEFSGFDLLWRSWSYIVRVFEEFRKSVLGEFWA